MSEVMKHFNVVAEALYESARKVGALKAENNRLRQAIAEAEKQEPVAWMTIDSNGEEDDIWYDNPEGKLLEGWSCKPLYTTPQPRKPLTDEQIDEIADTVANMPLVGIVNDFRTRFARAIEEAHGIKE